jgi:hypothetical protein
MGKDENKIGAQAKNVTAAVKQEAKTTFLSFFSWFSPKLSRKNSLLENPGSLRGLRYLTPTANDLNRAK